jgi:LPXTG-motif cell wall-anchored protein
MKRLIIIFCSVFLCLATLPGFTAFAADGNNLKEPSNVTITVVMPEPTQPPVEEEPAPPVSTFIKVYPSDVTEIRDTGVWEIIKTYELSAGEKPEDIPCDTFERSAGASGARWKFTLTDIIRKETANAETREHTETVTLNTDTKEIEKILPLFSPSMEYKADDGFIGIIALDVASIKVETAGTKTTSYTMSVTREYPRLSTNDTSLVPKTVEDKGKTYTLAGVDWRAGNYVTVDYEQVPEYYTAVATYTAKGSSTKVTGYVTTAVYTGTLAKMAQGKTVYTAYFLGEEIRTPLEMVTPTPETTAPPQAGEEAADPTPETEPTTEPTTEPSQTEPPQTDGKSNSGLVWLAIIPLSAIFAGGAVYFIMKRKVNHNAKTSHPVSDAADDSGDGSTGSGG